MKRSLYYLDIAFLMFALVCEPATTYCQSQDEAASFAPITPPRFLQARKIERRLTVDGRIDEAEWSLADSVGNFFQVQPIQGAFANPDTRVRILYNSQFLYIAATNYDSLGRAAIRAPDLKRDFDWGYHDTFGISLDPFCDKRNAQIFQTNPFGAQRDLLAFDDEFFDRDWDALWRVRTQRTSYGWTAEMAIPWKTLRYPKEDSVWNVNFLRIARRKNQYSSWNPYPRSTNSYRMAYAGLVRGLRPPPPSANLRFNPYVLYNTSRSLLNGDRMGTLHEPKLGGEVKWAISPNTVLDLTFNTDFAQADVDRQVNNLTRFSVFFPERRQFFLENASLFNVGMVESIQPFFSRRIGLDGSGNPIPIDAGIRLVSRDLRKSYGGMLVRQRSNDMYPASTFAVGRYSRNFGTQNRFGGIITAKLDDARDTVGAMHNFTYSGDAYFRLSNTVFWNVTGSVSTTSEKASGYSFVSQLQAQHNQYYLYYYQTVISNNYDPQVGFIYDRNIINTDFGGYRIFRKSWVPRFLRQVDPGGFAHIYHRATDGKFLQAQLELFPLYVITQTGGAGYAYVVPTWQSLPDPIRILDVPIGRGQYYYARYRFYYGNDQSRKFSFGVQYETGKYYNGRLVSWNLNCRYSPIPQVAFSVNYQHNQIDGLGEAGVSKTTDLVTPQLRLALNPRLQWITFYQYNSAVERGVLNTRFSWEYQPLSFLYVVFNDSRYQQFNTVESRSDVYQNQSGIFKITWMKQI